eukprot:TRINITY_DN24743_c0_g1_i1.p1 TRINITY_DN24743_c0_g1~~TRINITY_DN24743_c0_g1_i1.p1  ORF type:complete len:480 (+),score=135.57 TRINITY_DN24743_c0_g1_i1:78-1442(+)
MAAEWRYRPLGPACCGYSAVLLLSLAAPSGGAELGAEEPRRAEHGRGAPEARPRSREHSRHLHRSTGDETRQRRPSAAAVPRSPREHSRRHAHRPTAADEERLQRRPAPHSASSRRHLHRSPGAEEARRRELLARAEAAGAPQRPDERLYAELRREFRVLRQRLLQPAGMTPWTDEQLASAPQRLKRLTASRCARFHDEPRRHRRLVFTHVPKTGGQSMQIAIYRNAKTAGMDPKEDLLTGHLRYGDIFSWHPQFFNPAEETDFITVLRDPQALIRSDYSYMRRNPHHPGYLGAQRFRSLGHYIQTELDDGTGTAFALFAEHSRKNQTLERLRALCTRARRNQGRDPRLQWLCREGWAIYLARAAELLATRYAVVGILERLPETLEVLRCRLPWLKQLDSIPLHNKRPSNTSDSASAELWKAKTYQENRFYGWAQRMLDADLRCCRQRAAAPRG